MKWNTVMGSLVLGASLCTPSFGGGLLDRMLGMKGSGCDSVCCDTGCSVAPSCGCEIECAPACDSGKGCGLLGRLKNRGSNACAAPTCGCEIAACDPCGAAPSCGCEIAACDPCGAAPSCGCEIAACDPCGAAPSCGCEIAACDPCGSVCDTGCCKPRRRPLMELLGKMESTKRQMFAGLHSRKSCCDTGCDAPSCGAAPTCGCEIAACDPCGAAPTCGCEIAACDPCGAAPTCGCEIAACDPCASACDSGCGAKKSCGGLLGKLFKRKSSSCCDAIVSCDTGCSSCASGASMSAPVAAPIMHGDAAPMPPAPIVDPSAYLQSNRRVIQATSYVR